MSNVYGDSFIYAIDSDNQIYLVEYQYFASLSGGYRSLTCVNNKTYSVFNGADEDDEGRVDMYIEEEGDYLPCIWLKDCRSFFTGRPTLAMEQVVKEAKLDTTDIVKWICLHFSSTSTYIYSATGWEITENGANCVDDTILEKEIPSDENAELVAKKIIHQLI